MKASELLALSNLDGWRIGEGYYIELKHGLMGTFPAIISETGKEFVCLSEEDVKEAISLLPRGPYTAGNQLLFINDKEKIAFLLADFQEKWRLNYYQKDCSPETRISYESDSVLILTKEDFERMRIGDLKWAPGLVRTGMSRAEFIEMLDLAAKQTK